MSGDEQAERERIARALDVVLHVTEAVATWSHREPPKQLLSGKNIAWLRRRTEAA